MGLGIGFVTSLASDVFGVPFDELVVMTEVGLEIGVVVVVVGVAAAAAALGGSAGKSVNIGDVAMDPSGARSWK